VLRLGDDQAAAPPPHRPRLAQDRLDDVVRLLDAPFRLRDRLLRDHRDVAVL
jgi:hypothetical protein